MTTDELRAAGFDTDASDVEHELALAAWEGAEAITIDLGDLGAVIGDEDWRWARAGGY